MRRIGIECESIEGPESWGIGRIVKKLLEEISQRPELANEFRFFLYFKSAIPDLPCLHNPIFTKKVIGVSSFSLYYYLLLPVKLWFEKLDLVFFPNYMLPVIFHGKSLVMLTEDIYFEIHSGTLPWQYKLAYKIFAGWWTVKHATKIMAISETSKHELSKLFGISPNRIVVNSLGIDPPKIVTRNQQPEVSNYILYVGQAFPRRHLRETMLAFEIIAPHFPDLKLIAVGKDKYNPATIEKLKNEINARLGKEGIVWKEYVPENELAVLYTNAKLLIYVSSKEAFGLPPLEALGYGVPAVVADHPITREIFGDNAFFACPVRDRSSKMIANSNGITNYTPECITVAIKKALTDTAKRQEIIANADQILQKYTWQGFTKQFLEII